MDYIPSYWNKQAGIRIQEQVLRTGYRSQVSGLKSRLQGSGIRFKNQVLGLRFLFYLLPAFPVT
jgi:hypothetical protein